MSVTHLPRLLLAGLQVATARVQSRLEKRAGAVDVVVIDWME
jgi:hypothetical protein